MRGLFLWLPFAVAMHGGWDRPAAARPAAAAPVARITSDRFREMAHSTEGHTVTYLVTMAAALAVPLIGANDAQRQRRQDLIVATGLQFHRLLTDPTPGLPDPNAVVERQDDVPRLDNRLDASPRDVAEVARRWGDTEAVANMLNFRSDAELSANQRSALEELARTEGYASLSDLQSQTRTLPKHCFTWMRCLISRVVNGTQVVVTCDKGDNCQFRHTHRNTLMDFSRMEYLAYACAVCRNVFKIKPEDPPAAQREPAAQGGGDEEELNPELRLNPKWLRTLRTDRPGLNRVQSGYPINEHLLFHKDKAMSAVTERERMRQLNLLRGWCRDVLHRDAEAGYFDPDYDEAPPQRPDRGRMEAPPPPPSRGLTSGPLPALRGGPSISPAPKADHRRDRREPSPSARRQPRRERSRDRRDRSRDRDRSRGKTPRASVDLPAPVRASDHFQNDSTPEARIEQLQLQARLARAEAEALEAERALNRQRAGGSHGNRVLDFRRGSDPQRSGMSDTASDVSRSAVTPPGIGSARLSEVIGGLDSRGTPVGLPGMPLLARPPAPAVSLGGPPPRPPAVNSLPPAVRPAVHDDDDPQVISDDPHANVCSICYDKPRGARILPCGHDAFCLECIQQVQRGEAAGGERICPICRRDIGQVVPPNAVLPPGPPPAPPAAGAAPGAAGAPVSL